MANSTAICTSFKVDLFNGIHAFGPAMIAQATPAAIVNTGSKQGITCPPGDTAYNVSEYF